MLSLFLFVVECLVVRPWWLWLLLNVLLVTIFIPVIVVLLVVSSTANQMLLLGARVELVFGVALAVSSSQIVLLRVALQGEYMAACLLLLRH